MAPFDIEPFLKLKVEQTTDKSSQSREDILKQYPELSDETFDSWYGADTQGFKSNNTTQIPVGNIGFSKLFSTGTKLEFNLESKYSNEKDNEKVIKIFHTDTSSVSYSSYSNTGSITLTQPLLQGMGKKVRSFGCSAG